VNKRYRSYGKFQGFGITDPPSFSWFSLTLGTAIEQIATAKGFSGVNQAHSAF
jgi:hypothetical protein